MVPPPPLLAAANRMVSQKPGGAGIEVLWGRRCARLPVPDRFGQPAREVDLRDVGAALLADPCLGLLVAVAVDGRSEGMSRCFDKSAAQLAGSVLAEQGRAGRAHLMGRRAGKAAVPASLAAWGSA
jgi:hypothetical protein